MLPDLAHVRKVKYLTIAFQFLQILQCYVAVAGLPDKCDNHALAVAKFARDCMHKMPDVVHKLEILLGPDTADLELRIGINTGQVTVSCNFAGYIYIHTFQGV